MAIALTDVTELVTPPHEISQTRVLAAVLFRMGQDVGPERLEQAVARVLSRLEPVPKP